MWMLLPILLIGHAIGVFFGSRNATRINQKLLKRIVAVASILIAPHEAAPVNAKY